MTSKEYDRYISRTCGFMEAAEAIGANNRTVAACLFAEWRRAIDELLADPGAYECAMDLSGPVSVYTELAIAAGIDPGPRWDIPDDCPTCGGETIACDLDNYDPDLPSWPCPEVNCHRGFVAPFHGLRRRLFNDDEFQSIAVHNGHYVTV